MPRLSSKFIGDISRPQQGQVLYRDDELTGFGLRVTKGSMSFIVESRVDGKVRRITIGRFPDVPPDAARKEAQRILGQIGRSKARGPTIAEVLDAYVQNRRLRPRTIVNYRKAVRLHLGDWAALPVTEITSEMVVARHRELGKRLKGNTANAVIHVLRALLYYANENYGPGDGQPLIPVNPVNKLSRTQSWYRKERRHSVIPDHQLAAWYRAMMSVTCTSRNVSDYLLLLLLTGLRRNEAATLRWSDVDLEARILTIRGEIAKNHRQHQLPLSDFLLVLLKRRKAQTSNSEYVFPGRYGGHMVSYLRIFHRIAHMSRCKFMLHDLRRTFVSMAAKLGVQHHLTKRLLNHIGNKDDTDEYIVISTEHLREPMELITARFLELMEVEPEDWKQPPQTVKYKVATVTLSEVLEHYLAARKLGQESYKAYRRAVEKRLTEWLPLPVASITEDMVRIKYQELSTTDGLCKASTVQANYTMRVLKSLLNFAAENYQVDGKPVVLVNPVKALKQINSWNRLAPRKNVITDEELPSWYQAVISLRSTTVRDLLLLMLHTGLPKAAAANICWSNIDFKSRVLTARTRNGKGQTIPMSSFVLELMRKRYSQRKSQYVFPGRTQQIDRVTEVLDQVREKSGCQFTLEDLRRTFLQTAQRLGLVQIALQQLAIRGCGSEQVVGDMLSVEKLRQPMQKISDEFTRLMGIEVTLPRKAG